MCEVKRANDGMMELHVHPIVVAIEKLRRAEGNERDGTIASGILVALAAAVWIGIEWILRRKCKRLEVAASPTPTQAFSGGSASNAATLKDTAQRPDFAASCACALARDSPITSVAGCERGLIRYRFLPRRRCEPAQLRWVPCARATSLLTLAKALRHSDHLPDRRVIERLTPRSRHKRPNGDLAHW